MDASYYFVLETDGVDDGPYRLPEIQRRIHIGLISKQASLVKCGETNYVPLTDVRYAHLLEAPPEPAPVAKAGIPPKQVVTPEPEPKIEVVVKPEPGRAAAGTVPPPAERPVASTLMMTPSPSAPVAPMPVAEPRAAAAMPVTPSQTFMAPPPVPTRAAPPPIPAAALVHAPTPSSSAPTAFAPAMSSPSISVPTAAPSAPTAFAMPAPQMPPPHVVMPSAAPSAPTMSSSIPTSASNGFAMPQTAMPMPMPAPTAVATPMPAPDFARPISYAEAGILPNAPSATSPASAPAAFAQMPVAQHAAPMPVPPTVSAHAPTAFAMQSPQMQSPQMPTPQMPTPQMQSPQMPQPMQSQPMQPWPIHAHPAPAAAPMMPPMSSPAISPPAPAAFAPPVATSHGHEFPRVAPTVAITPDASFSMPFASSTPEPQFPRVAPTVAIEAAVPDVAKAPSAKALIAKAKAKSDKSASHGPLATAQTAFIAPPQPPVAQLSHAPTALSIDDLPPANLQPPAVAVMPRGFVAQRPVEAEPPFAINAEGSAPLTMPEPYHAGHSGPVAMMPHHEQLALPPPQAMQMYEQPYEPEAHATMATPKFAPGWWKSKKVLAIGGSGVAALILIPALAIGLRGGSTGGVKDAMVRVSTASGTGAGFFIAGPDQYAYVATANHVVDRGERVLVERDVGADKSAFVEAYPETEIVASDADADLAIIRIKNVDASRFPQLQLAKEPVKDEHILSYGYPGSSLATKTGLVNKDGKILSLVSFPAYDERYQRVLRDNAVDGLLISTDIEPGMSGGPTTNDAGDVVGVNVTKDRAHTGQNGAVSVVALRTLVGTIKPAADRAAPSTDDVAKLLERIQSEYLLLPLDERKKVRETDFVSSADLPQLRQLVNEVRREERNTDTSFIAKYRLSGQAALGIFFARMPGKLLETYRAPSTTAPIVSCELANQRLTSFLGDLSSTDKKIEAPKTSLSSCDELAVRPLAWDLVAATLQYDGKEQKYTVAKLDKMDEDGKVFRAQVRISGTTNLIELWIGMDRGTPRLKVFDPTGSLYAIKSPRNVAPSALQGTWSIKRPRVTDAINKEAEVESSETLSISVDDNKVSIRNVVTEHYFGAGNRARVFTCNGKKTIETGLLQSFTGTLENGVVVGFPDKEAEAVGPDAGYCRPAHKSDRIVAVKLAGDQLYLYRTDGNAYPDTVQLTRDTTAIAPATTP